MSAVDTVSPAATAPASDSELVWAVRDGDDEAFEELFRRYQGRIRSFAARRVGDHCRAEDVTQDVFISALRRMRATDSEIAFKPWLFEIARNATIDLHRRTSRTEEVPVHEMELVGSGPPEAEVLARERLAHLRGAFGELNEVHHRALVMRELEGRSYREIAERLELTRPAVESVLFRARRRLAKEYRALRARAAALLPFPAFGHGTQSGTTAAGEQVAALVTAVALAVAGGAALERAGSASGSPPDASAGFGAAATPEVRPDPRPSLPAPPPGSEARPEHPVQAAPAPATPAAPRAEEPAAPPAPAPAPGDEPAGGSTGSSQLPPVGLELGESADRPPTLPVAPTATQPLAAVPLPAVPLPATELPSAELEGGVRPVVDAVKGLAPAG